MMQKFSRLPSFSVFFLCISAAVILSKSGASALEKDHAIESCRNSTGKPAYSACMQAGGTHDTCFGRARSVVQACVRSAMMAARPKAALFSADKLTAPVPEAGVAD